MPSAQKSLRIPQGTVREIEGLAKEYGKDFTAMANDLLEEGIKARQCPGIVFSEGTSGKRARIAGTGVEVWEVIASYGSVGRDFKRLRKTYHWLTEAQLKSAVAYETLYPKEIAARIDLNRQWTARNVSKRHPFLAARRP